MSTNSSKYSVILLLAGVLFIIWGILGIMDAKNYTTSGYQTDDNNAIVLVDHDSPAEKAGMQVGDVIISSGGIDINDNKALSERERPAIGDTREFVIERDGTESRVVLTYEGLSDRDNTLNTIGFVVGLLFIVLGLYSNNKHKSALSYAFALFAVCFGFIFMNGPYISPGILTSVVNSISGTIIVFSFCALAEYLLKYPNESKYNAKLLMLPSILAALLIWILNFAQPDGSGTINMVIRLFFGAVIIFYFATALITLLRKYFKATSAERKARGLNMMLIGSLIGLLPILVYFTANTVSPGIDLPGNDYVGLTFAAIPIFFMLALNQAAKGSSTATTD